MLTAIQDLNSRTGELKTKTERLDNENKELKKENEKLKTNTERLGDENKELEKRFEKVEKVMENQDKVIDDLREVLQQEKDDRKEDIEALREVILMIMPLHHRVFLDLTRQKILENFECESWESLRENRSVYQLKNHIFKSLPAATRPSLEAIEFLCSYNNVRRDGNAAAHDASKEDVRTAVIGKPVESKDRRCLEEMYVYTYGDRI
ncbi:hypothetical protein AX16_005430 [Volvariella volvacea WC 439]|nr:hypothetical protein AX16_005430 [Volvariella volvacea WC 439]